MKVTLVFNTCKMYAYVPQTGDMGDLGIEKKSKFAEMQTAMEKSNAMILSDLSFSFSLPPLVSFEDRIVFRAPKSPIPKMFHSSTLNYH